MSAEHRSTLAERINLRSAVAGVIGLGYVGLPLAVAIAKAGFRTIGFDIDPDKPSEIANGRSYIDAVSDGELAQLVSQARFSATSDYLDLAQCDVVIVCVPTPLTRHREPDLSFVENTIRAVARHGRSGQLIVLESTTYPGTTVDVVKPILEVNGWRSGLDFLLAFSPEREDPGNRAFRTATIPKVVGGDGQDATEIACAFYGAVVEKVVPVSSPAVAEAVKITENVFRAVNIALVNELKVVFDRMDVDVWEVIEAAKTKPFGFMPFYPGPGLGGHCIPIDPFYLTWKSREYDVPTRFIELAGEINLSMPRYVVGKLEEALDRRLRKSLSAAKVLVVGLAYKKNVADIREAPAFKLMDLLERRGAAVAFHDPHVPAIPQTREHPEYAGRRSLSLDEATLKGHDALIIVTDHDAIDYASIARNSPLIVDTRNAFASRGIACDVVKA